MTFVSINVNRLHLFWQKKDVVILMPTGGGVEELKLEKYRADCVSEIQKYCRTNNLSPRINLNAIKRVSVRVLF
jgi:hypothetical protein